MSEMHLESLVRLRKELAECSPEIGPDNLPTMQDTLPASFEQLRRTQKTQKWSYLQSVEEASFIQAIGRGLYGFEPPNNMREREDKKKNNKGIQRAIEHELKAIETLKRDINENHMQCKQKYITTEQQVEAVLEVAERPAKMSGSQGELDRVLSQRRQEVNRCGTFYERVGARSDADSGADYPMADEVTGLDVSRKNFELQQEDEARNQRIDRKRKERLRLVEEMRCVQQEEADSTSKMIARQLAHDTEAQNVSSLEKTIRLTMTSGGPEIHINEQTNSILLGPSESMDRARADEMRSWPESHRTITVESDDQCRLIKVAAHNLLQLEKEATFAASQDGLAFFVAAVWEKLSIAAEQAVVAKTGGGA